jgi:hypothetical protein
MARFPYHRLPSEYAFQDLVCDVCQHLLGEGVERFAKGKDGGRDARFSGKANRFPSAAAPLSGKFIVQAKWTEDESGSFADAKVQRLLKQEEVPKAKVLKEAGELEHWIIISNRRKNAISATKLERELLKAVGSQSVHLRGIEELNGWLKDLPTLVKAYNLEGLLVPFRVDPLELREVIETLYANRRQALAAASSRWDYAGYAGIEQKNTVNKLTERYFKASIRDQSEPHFAAIKAFLENPRNAQLAERYHEAATEMQAKAMTFRDRFDAFEQIIEHVCDEVSANFHAFGKKRVLRVILHYMYANCDFGQKSQ